MIQDDAREIELVKLFKLKQHINRKRHELDAFLEYAGNDYKFELKSTTVINVSTASPLTLNHIRRWRDYHWIIGIYNSKYKLEYCYFGFPEDMKEWLDFWENDILRGIKISNLLIEKIDKKMVKEIFGNKKIFTKEDLFPQMKNTFTKEEYEILKDESDGYSLDRTLEMFKESNKKYLYSGSNINNPKIPKNVYSKWNLITGNYDKELRNLIKNH
jgi:hypothetical protein